ncbi:hypothetical protein P3T36_007625 [Kitasatospora sp. MAP12-15]|uniref:hypothetical protein n=1 Tax=unclassified Kitasatospora TaxID=2633591 RepID=UPI00247581BC|nr:hypothetical protein [Kitasatospora sp. MAP12-44]MDH6109215.1 hypothetical protein [Kitasatospora sp. MAP12-44]
MIPMSSGTAALRTQTPPLLALRLRQAGDAMLIHAKGGADPQALAFAQRLAPDTQNTLVVVDLPFGALEPHWQQLARLLDRLPGKGLRLVFGRATPQESRAVGQLLAERLQRTVLAPDGELLPTAHGGLFIPADYGAGWLRMRPGHPLERDSLRFPKPMWDFSTSDRPWECSPYGVVEAVPSGVWVRSARPSPPLAGWRRLVDRVPSHPQLMNVVLGSPGGPAVPLDDIVRVWDTVMHSVRSWVRFIHFGPVALPEGGVSVGQELADAIGRQVVLYAGMPTIESGDGSVGGGPVRIMGLRGDGSPGWSPFAAELVYSPRGAAAQAPPPGLVRIRHPLTEVHQLGPGLYQYAADAVLEVISSGLWIRPAEDPAGADDVRRLPCAPGHPVILYDRSTPATAERMRALAQDMLWRLDPESREAFRVAPADAPGLTAAADDHAWTVPPTAEDWRAVAAARAAERRPLHEAPWIPRAVAAAPAAAPSAPAGGMALGDTLDAPSPAGPRTMPTTAPAQTPFPLRLRTESDAATPGSALAAALGALSSDGAVLPPAPPMETDATGTAAAGPHHAPARADDPAGPRPGTPARSAGSGGGDRVHEPRPTGPQTPTVLPPAGDGPSRERLKGVSRVAAALAGRLAGSGPQPDSGQPGADTREPGAARQGEPDGGRADAPGTPPQPDLRAKERVNPPAPLSHHGVAPLAAAGPDLPLPAGGAPAGPDTVIGGGEPAPRLAPEPPTRTENGDGVAEPPPTGRQAPGAIPAPVPGPSPSPPGAGHTRPLPRLVEAESPPPVSLPALAPPPVPSPGDTPAEPAAPSAPAPAPMAVPRIRMESGAVPESVAVPPPVPVPAQAAPAQPVAGVRVQTAPGQAAAVVPPARGLEQERAWVRRTFSARYNAIAGTVSRVMSESPGLRGASRSDAADALTDLVAVRLYLSGDSTAVDDAVRAATTGPHVPLARCVTAGLRRLPSYRGPALLRTRLTAAERAWYADGRTAIEWAFCTGWTAPPPAPAGGTDFLIWSMTARRTALLDPSAPDRVLFLPGTAFKVLRTDESGDRPVVLLRELSPAEAAADPDAGAAALADPAARRLPLDEIALDSLERSVTALGLESRSETSRTPGVLGNPPGLLIARDRLRPTTDRGQAPEGAAR